MGKSSASASQAKQTNPKPPPPPSSEGFCLLQARGWFFAPGRAMRGLVLTLSCPLGSPVRFCSYLDSQRGHPVKVLGETPSCGLSHTHQPECIKGARVMPPCGGDSQKEGPRTGSPTISSLLQQPLLGVKQVGGPETGYKPKASKSLYKEGEVQDGDYQVYREIVISRRLGDIHRPERCVLPQSGTSRLPEVPQDSGRGQGFPVQVSAFQTVTSPKGVLSVTGGTLLHKLTIYLHLYLDDWLLRATSRSICLAQTR